MRQRREEATGGVASERGVARARSKGTRSPLLFYSRLSAAAAKRGSAERGRERGRRARAVPERPRSFLSYPENRSLRHAALDDRHRITRVHRRMDGQHSNNLHRVTLFHIHTRTHTHTFRYTRVQEIEMLLFLFDLLPFRLFYSYPFLLRSLPFLAGFFFPSFSSLV